MKRLSLGIVLACWSLAALFLATFFPKLLFWYALASVAVLAIAAVTAFWRENRKVLQPIPEKIRSGAFFDTIAKYAPLLTALVAGVLLQFYVQYQTTLALYEENILLKSDKQQGEIGYWRNTRSVEADAVDTAQQNYKQSRDKFVAAFNAGGDALKNEIEVQRREVPNLFGQAFDRDVLPRCPWWIGLVCRGMNSSYRDAVRAQQRKLQNDLDRRAAAYNAGDKSVRALAIEEISQSFDALEQGTLASIRFYFAAMAFLGALAVVLLVLAILKSLGYLYARLLLTASGAQQDFAHKALRVRTGNFDLPEERNNVEIDLHPGERFYVATDLNFLGNVERKEIPSPFKLTFARLLDRKLVMHRIDGSPQRTADVKVEANLGHQFVEVDLRKDEELIFHMRYLAGFSSTITFHKYLNYRLMGLVFGRLTYFSAAGPGRLLLLVPGGCTLAEANQDFLQHRLVAWKNTAKFSVTSSPLLADLYWSGISVCERNGRSCIIENATSLRHRNYLSRFFRRFFWPL